MRTTSVRAVLVVLAGLAAPAAAGASEALVVEPVIIQDRKAVFAQVESVDELGRLARESAVL